MNELIELEENYRAIIGQPSINYEKFKERFLLAKSITTVTFSEELKSQIKKQCYSRLIKLCELWYAFEKFLSVLTDQQFIVGDTLSKPSMITDELETRFELHELVKNCNDEILLSFNTEQKKTKLKSFINHLHSKGDDKQKKLLNAAENKIDNLVHNGFKIQEILSMVYAIRNLHVHDGDTFIDAMKSFELTKDYLYILASFLESVTETSWKKSLELNIAKIENE